MTNPELTPHTALLVIDMQNCFFESDNLAQMRAELSNACNELIEKAHQALAPVVMVRTRHREDGSTWTRNMIEDNQGFAFVGDDDSLFIDELTDWATLEVIKTRDSAFYATDLEDRLRQANVNRIVICGVSTHSCVALTAADAYARDFEVVLARDAIYSDKPELHKVALDYLHTEYRQVVLANHQISFT